MPRPISQMAAPPNASNRHATVESPVPLQIRVSHKFGSPSAAGTRTRIKTFARRPRRRIKNRHRSPLHTAAVPFSCPRGFLRQGLRRSETTEEAPSPAAPVVASRTGTGRPSTPPPFPSPALEDSSGRDSDSWKQQKRHLPRPPRRHNADRNHRAPLHGSPLKGSLPTEYLVPKNFVLGKGQVRVLQEKLVANYESLADTTNDYLDARGRAAHYGLEPFKAMMDESKDLIRETRYKIVQLRASIRDLGHLPLPPNPEVDAKVASILGSRVISADSSESSGPRIRRPDAKGNGAMSTRAAARRRVEAAWDERARTG